MDVEKVLNKSVHFRVRETQLQTNSPILNGSSIPTSNNKSFVQRFELQLYIIMTISTWCVLFTPTPYLRCERPDPILAIVVALDV